MAGKPLPVPTEDTAFFWERCREGQLMLQRCQACGQRQFYPRAVCTSCLSPRLDWVPSTGRGTVYSHSTVFRAPTSAFQTDTPYVVAMVELEEGVRLITHIVGCAADHVRVGMAVSVIFEPVSADISLPKFEPAGASTPPRPR